MPGSVLCAYEVNPFFDNVLRTDAENLNVVAKGDEATGVPEELDVCPSHGLEGQGGKQRRRIVWRNPALPYQDMHGWSVPAPRGRNR